MSKFIVMTQDKINIKFKVFFFIFNSRNPINKNLKIILKWIILIKMCFVFFYRSWFIDESVCSDGRVFITTKIDVTYIILPYLMKVQ